MTSSRFEFLDSAINIDRCQLYLLNVGVYCTPTLL